MTNQPTTTHTPERDDLETLITAAEGDVITVSYESTHPNAGRITKTVEVLADPYRYDKPEDDHMAADVPVRDLNRDDSPYALIYAHVDIPYNVDPDGIAELEDLFSTFSGYSDHHPAHTPGAVGRRLGTALRIEDTEDDIVGCLGCGFGYPADEWSSCPVCSDGEDDEPELVTDGGMTNPDEDRTIRDTISLAPNFRDGCVWVTLEVGERFHPRRCVSPDKAREMADGLEQLDSHGEPAPGGAIEGPTIGTSDDETQAVIETLREMADAVEPSTGGE